MRPSRFAILFIGLLTGAAPTGATAQEPAPGRPVIRRIPLGESTEASIKGRLSPDGRWFVFNRGEGIGTSLWSVPAAGGEPQRLTSPGYEDFGVDFFPSGDRIVFVSNRPARDGDRNYYTMVIAFDRATGRAAGTARQLSLEHAVAALPSPDGRGVLVVERGDSTRLWLVPAEGGRGRRVAAFRASPETVYAWSGDSRQIFSVVRVPVGAPTNGSHPNWVHAVMRTPIDGGASAEVSRFNQGVIMAINGASGYVVAEDQVAPGDRRLRLVTFDGRVLADLGTGRTVRASRISADGRLLYGVESDLVGQIRIVPLSGGEARSLPAHEGSRDVAVGWTGDGRAVIAQGRDGDRRVTRVMPLDGSEGAPLALPQDGRGQTWWYGGANSTHAAYVLTDPATGRRRLVAVSLVDGSRTELSGNLATIPGVSPAGPGNRRAVDGTDFLYLERSGDLLQLIARTPGSSPRLVRTFPVPEGRARFAVAGSRVAWAEPVGDSVRIMVTTTRTDSPHEVAALTKSGATGLELVFSRDGRFLAVNGNALRIIEVASDGAVAGSRSVETGFEYIFDVQWLPDDNGLTFVASDGNRQRVGLVSLRDGNRASSVTPPEAAQFIWDHLVSPDGGFVAYTDERVEGAALWMMDLPRLTTGGGR